MDEAKLRGYLAHIQGAHVLVLGDYFLDKYLILDPALSEVSLETGLEAYQVVEVRCSPGAAGNVAANLCALGAQVTALGVLGDDGEGFELRRALEGLGVDISPLLSPDGRFTPTYTKPMMREPDGRQHELNRLDIKNRAPLAPGIEDVLIERLQGLAGGVHAMVVADQVQERNCGVVTDRVREAICELGRAHPGLVMGVDSRERIGEYGHAALKPNRREAARAVIPGWQGDEGELGLATAMEHGRKLQQRAGRPVFLTMAEQGILVVDEEGESLVPAVLVRGPIDPVGAGDTTMAGLVLALCAGASPAEAALVGNLAASVTIQKIGTTGTASPAEVLAAFHKMEGKA